MKDLTSWLNNGKPKKQSKFLNQRLRVGEEFIGIYQSFIQTENNFGKTVHYALTGEDGEVIFDSHNLKIAEFFSCIPFKARVCIKKIFKNGRILYDVKLLSTLKDEEGLARLATEAERAREAKREENKRDKR